jgi:hypothetical protein
VEASQRIVEPVNHGQLGGLPQEQNCRFLNLEFYTESFPDPTLFRAAPAIQTLGVDVCLPDIAGRLSEPAPGRITGLQPINNRTEAAPIGDFA